MLDGAARFTVACKRCPMQLVVELIRDAEAAVMADHLREQHPELGVSRPTALGDVFEHYRVTRTRG